MRRGRGAVTIGARGRDSAVRCSGRCGKGVRWIGCTLVESGSGTVVEWQAENSVVFRVCLGRIASRLRFALLCLCFRFAWNGFLARRAVPCPAVPYSRSVIKRSLRSLFANVPLPRMAQARARRWIGVHPVRLVSRCQGSLVSSRGCSGAFPRRGRGRKATWPCVHGGSGAGVFFGPPCACLYRAIATIPGHAVEQRRWRRLGPRPFASCLCLHGRRGVRGCKEQALPAAECQTLDAIVRLAGVEEQVSCPEGEAALACIACSLRLSSNDKGFGPTRPFTDCRASRPCQCARRRSWAGRRRRSRRAAPSWRSPRSQPDSQRRSRGN